MGVIAALLPDIGRIGPDYLGIVVPLVTFLIALCSAVFLYRRFMVK